MKRFPAFLAMLAAGTMLVTSISEQSSAENTSPKLPELEVVYQPTFPEKALAKGKDGCVYVQFQIESDGTTRNVKVLESSKYFYKSGKFFFKKLKFAPPSEAIPEATPKVFLGLFQYRLEVTGIQDGETRRFQNRWTCPWADMPYDFEKTITLIPDMTQSKIKVDTSNLVRVF